MATTTPVQLVKATIERRERCHRCHRPWTYFVFKTATSSIWQRRCQRCAEQMVKDGKASFKAEGER